MGVVFALALAVVMGLRMSAEALAAVAGAIVGGVLGVVLSVVAMAARGRMTEETGRRGDAEMGRGQAASYPPVVVIQGGQPASWGGAPLLGQAQTTFGMEVGCRKMRVLGEE